MLHSVNAVLRMSPLLERSKWKGNQGCSRKYEHSSSVIYESSKGLTSPCGVDVCVCLGGKSMLSCVACVKLGSDEDELVGDKMTDLQISHLGVIAYLPQ